TISAARDSSTIVSRMSIWTLLASEHAKWTVDAVSTRNAYEARHDPLSCSCALLESGNPRRDGPARVGQRQGLEPDGPRGVGPDQEGAQGADADRDQREIGRLLQPDQQFRRGRV